LLKLEDVLVEKELKLLVGVVNAKLLEAVLLEVLKSEDVQDSHERKTLGLANGGIDGLENPSEHATVKGLGQGIQRILGLQKEEKERKKNLRMWTTASDE